MTNLLYLGIAVLLSLVGSFVLWLRSRQPHSMEAGMREFARELQALAPQPPEQDERQRRSG